MDASQLVKPDTLPNLPEFGAGDTVRVNFRIREGDRERVQAFQGVVIRRQMAQVRERTSPYVESLGEGLGENESFHYIPH